MDILVADFQRVRCHIENLSIPIVPTHQNMMCAGSHGCSARKGGCAPHPNFPWIDGELFLMWLLSTKCQQVEVFARGKIM